MQHYHHVPVQPIVSKFTVVHVAVRPREQPLACFLACLKPSMVHVFVAVRKSTLAFDVPFVKIPTVKTTVGQFQHTNPMPFAVLPQPIVHVATFIVVHHPFPHHFVPFPPPHVHVALGKGRFPVPVPHATEPTPDVFLPTALQQCPKTIVLAPGPSAGVRASVRVGADAFAFPPVVHPIPTVPFPRRVLDDALPPRLALFAHPDERVPRGFGKTTNAVVLAVQPIAFVPVSVRTGQYTMATHASILPFPDVHLAVRVGQLPPPVPHVSQPLPHVTFARFGDKGPAPHSSAIAPFPRVPVSVGVRHGPVAVVLVVQQQAHVHGTTGVLASALPRLHLVPVVLFGQFLKLIRRQIHHKSVVVVVVKTALPTGVQHFFFPSFSSLFSSLSTFSSLPAFFLLFPTFLGPRLLFVHTFSPSHTPSLFALRTSQVTSQCRKFFQT